MSEPLDTPISADHVARIISFLPQLQAVNPDQVVVKSPIQIDEERHLVILSAHRKNHPVVNELMSALYECGFVRDFDWTKWQRYAIGLYEHPERLNTAKLKTCVKLLTLHARKDRFCDGHFAAMIASGHMSAILMRMEHFLNLLG